MALNLFLHKQSETPSDNLIVLIHGLGAPDSTWTHGGVSWIDLFLSDNTISSLDVAEITYDTAHLANGLLSLMGIKKIKLGRFKSITVGKGPCTTIEILARELKREIDSKKIKQYKNVILIGHSMGGLVAIRYILEELENNQSHNVKGLISLATPYNGSSFAFYSQLIKSINRHAQIPSLEPNSSFLDETIRLWQKHLDGLNLDFKFFFGTEDTVVPENSAIPHIVSSKWTGGIPLPGDHSGILNVENHSSTSYIHISEAVKEIFEKDIVFNKKRIDESLLSMKNKAVVSIVDESIGKSEGNIIKAIEEKLGDDYLLEQKIEAIGFQIDKGLYDESLGAIAEMFESVGNISKEQRAKLLYQKARIYINTDEIEKISAIRKSIQHNFPESKYIDEIDYWIGYHNNNYELVSAAIQRLREKGTDEQNLVLKESNYQLQLGNFDTVKELLLDEENNVKSILRNDASAFSHLGFVSLFRNNFEKAESYFKEAIKIKYNISYDYHMTIAKAFICIKNLREKSVINDELKERAREIYNDFERTKHFIKGQSKDLRIQHWCNYLILMEVVNPELAIKEIENIDEDLINEEQIHIVVSEINFFFGDYENAMKYLEYIWDKDSVFLARLLYCYSKLNRWDLVEKTFEEDIEYLYDKQGIIFFYKIQLFEKANKIVDAKQLIMANSEQYKNSTWFIEKALTFLYEHGITDVYEILLGYISDLPDQAEFNEKLSLARVLYNHGQFQFTREMLEKSILINDEALELYLYSYGEVYPHNENFDELQQLVLSFYSKGNRLKYLLQVKFYVELLTERYIDAMDSILEYKTVHGEDSFYQINLLQCITLGFLSYDATHEANMLLDTSELRNHIIVAQYFAYKGRWEDAKSVLRNAYYGYIEQIEEDGIAGFVRIYLNNFHQEKGVVEYPQISDDTVSTLENSEGIIQRVSIHSNDGIITENGENKFGCINLKSTSDDSYILKATGKKGSLVEFKGEKYKVLEILDIDTYFFRYFLQKLQEDYPENKTVIPISGETIEQMIEKTTVYIQSGKEETENKLKLYNFDIETGVPISYLSGKDVDKYFETIYFLLNNEEQGLYSVYSSDVKKGAKYVLTISSLVILNALGYLDKLQSISDRLYITPSIKLFVRNGISDSVKYDSVVSTAFLDENSNFRMEESTEATKTFKKTFWTQILMAINKFHELKPEVINTSYYDKIYEFVDISEFEAINIASNEGAILVCDDLFISKICNAVNNTTFVVNIIALLYKEELIDINELIKLLKGLTKKKYRNCVNHNMLFDIYSHLVQLYNTPDYDKLYIQVSEIFENLFAEQSRDYHGHLYRNFIDLVRRNNMMSGILYKLLQKPLGFRPYDELLANAWNNVKIELKGTD